MGAPFGLPINAVPGDALPGINDSLALAQDSVKKSGFTNVGPSNNGNERNGHNKSGQPAAVYSGLGPLKVIEQQFTIKIFHNNS